MCQYVMTYVRCTKPASITVLTLRMYLYVKTDVCTEPVSITVLSVYLYVKTDVCTEPASMTVMYENGC